MPVLAARDAERLLRFVADTEQIGGDQLFTPELLVELGQLIRADWVSYDELDRVRRRNLFYVVRPGEEDEDDEFDEDLFWNVVIEEHPICLAHQLGEFSAKKLSDFASPSELRQRRIYDIWFRQWGIEHELEGDSVADVAHEDADVRPSERS